MRQFLFYPATYEFPDGKYLDERFPEPALRPRGAAERAEMQARIAESSAFQPTIKVVSHERLFRPFRKVGPDDIALYEREHRSPELVAFLRDYAQEGPAWKARVEDADRELDACLGRLESNLDRTPWLTGDQYGLADVSWVVNANRLLQAGVDLSPWPALADWAVRAMARPAFDRAVTSYRPG